MSVERYGLTEDSFLDELHHLLWVKPFKNKGKQDQGLSCRDHAALVGVVARRLGASVARIHGIMIFITGEDTPKNLITTDPHTWLSVDAKTPCDLSFRVTRKFSGGTIWKTKCIWNGEAVNECDVTVATVSSDQELKRVVADCRVKDLNRAVIYRPIYVVPLVKNDRSVFEELGSPLKDEIKFSTGAEVEVFLAMADFLVRKAGGLGETFVKSTRELAWRDLLTERSTLKE